MKAVVFDGQLRLTTDRPEPSPPPGEARIRTILAGICNTDLEVVRGYPDFAACWATSSWAWWSGRRPGVARPAGGGRDQRRLRRVPHLPGRPASTARAAPRWASSAATARSPSSSPADRQPAPGARRRAGSAAVFVEPLAAACEILEQVHVRPTDRASCSATASWGCWRRRCWP